MQTKSHLQLPPQLAGIETQSLCSSVLQRQQIETSYRSIPNTTYLQLPVTLTTQIYHSSPLLPSLNRNQMYLKCMPLQGFTLQFKVETSHWNGLRSAENVQLRFSYIMDNGRGLSCSLQWSKVLHIKQSGQCD